jgi:putative transposase
MTNHASWGSVTMAISFKGAHFPQDIILMGVRWYLAYPLSYRHVEELLEERGVPIDHATIQRWVVKYSPQLEEAFHRRKRPVWVSWRMDETYIKVKGQWYYLYRAVDKTGQTIDFLLTEQRDEQAAKRFLTKAIRRHGVPEKITIDGSAANEAAIKSYNEEHGTAIAIRKVKYLNNIVEIVFTQLTKTHVLASGMRGNDIADFDFSIGHDDRSCIRPLRIIHSTPKHATMSPLHHPLRGHCHGTNPLLLPTRSRGAGVRLPDALLAVAQRRRFPSPAARANQAIPT